MDTESTYDSIVVGAGLGGLLVALQCLRRGQRVAVVERLARPGGRFSARAYQGAQVSTGAVHLLPFGNRGAVAHMLDTLDVPYAVQDATVFGSVHLRGRQYVLRTPLQLAQALGARQFVTLSRLATTLALRSPTVREPEQCFAAWLETQGVTPQRTPELFLLFARMCEFALSVDVHVVSYAAVAAVLQRMLAAGPPGVLVGGCGALSETLAQAIRDRGGTRLLSHEVRALAREPSGVWQASLHERHGGADRQLHAHMIVSDIGPQATARLAAPQLAKTTGNGDAIRDHAAYPYESVGAALAAAPPVASGLKVQLLSSISVVPHGGVMYCLDTARIAGMVQPSNGDHSLAPPGEHLVVMHQILRSADVRAEEAAALDDLRLIFGDDLGTRVRVLLISRHSGDWPVNRAMQGQDVGPETPLSGLYLVGDAVKPAGYLMTEGVAQGVASLMALLDNADADDAPLTITRSRQTIGESAHWLTERIRLVSAGLRWL